MEVLFHRLAAQEYRQARAWYGRRSAAVARRFSQAVGHAVDQIAQRADSLPVLEGPHRYLRAGRFPYLLIFRSVDSHAVMVLALAHTSRRPGYWRRRT